jgi:hypothetical protein
MMGETKSRRSPNNLPTRPAGVRGSDHRPSAFQRRREGISGVLLAAAFGRSLTGHDSSRPVPVGAPTTTLGGEDSVVQNHIEQRFMNSNAAVILNEAELAKAIHEEADA